MQKLHWTTVQKEVNELIPQKLNPRTISDQQLADIKRSLERFNLVEIPAIDADGTILAGHQRIKALKLIGRGYEQIDVRVPNRKLTEDEAKRYLIASNALGGDWDFEGLKQFDHDLLLDVGFDSETLNDIWDTSVSIAPKEFDEVKAIDAITTPKTKLGDVITLGQHRLICGDSTNPETIQKLCGDTKVSMIMSDPVYNISLDYNKGLGGEQNYGAEVNDTRSTEEYTDFLRRSLTSALTVTKPDAHIFYWNTEQHIWIVQSLYNELGIANKRVCIWIKNGHNPTPQVAFNKCYEPCIYGTIGKPSLTKHTEYTEVMNSEIGSGNEGLDTVNIWAEKRLSGTEYKHATSKPSSVYEKAIRRCTKVGDVILDSFGGSGSTLIAAEQLKRTAYLVELEPVFCDVICQRFEALTGIKPIYESYAEIKTDNQTVSG